MRRVIKCEIVYSLSIVRLGNEAEDSGHGFYESSDGADLLQLSGQSPASQHPGELYDDTVHHVNQELGEAHLPPSNTAHTKCLQKWFGHFKHGISSRINRMSQESCSTSDQIRILNLFLITQNGSLTQDFVVRTLIISNI